MKKLPLLPLTAILFIILPSLLEGSGMGCFSQPIRNWGTYYGGDKYDGGNSVAVDANGNVYLAGETYAANNISTAGSHQPVHGGGTSDAFIVKFNSAGVRQWATYYGGPGEDYGHSVAVDANGDVYLAGTTTSATTGVISTAGGHQSAYGGGTDAFVVKFNSSGIRQWATYYGGGGYDEGRSIGVDASGNIYMGGYTKSTAGISTPGGHQPAHGGGYYNAYVIKLSSSGVRQWATYYGGTDYDDGYSVAVEANGNVYLAGSAASLTGISTAGSHQPAHGSGYFNVYLVKFDNAGVRQWATYYAGAGEAYGKSVAVDASGNICLTGSTTSLAGISTAGSHQQAYGGVRDAFLAKFSPSGVRQWATYYGGSDYDDGNSVVMDASGNIYLAGETHSNSAISTAGSHQPALGGGSGSDAYIAKFSASGVRQWATYYGGKDGDIGKSIAVQGCGNIYLGGNTFSISDISTPGCHQPVFGGIAHPKWPDAFLAKFDGCASSISVTATGANICPGYCATVTANINGGNAPFTYSWFPSGQTAASIVACPSSTTAYSVTITDAAGAVAMDTALVTITNCCSVAAVINSDPAPNTTFCVGQNVFMAASGGVSYVWNTGDTDENIAATLSVTTTYSVTATDAAGCTGTASITFVVDSNCTTTGVSQFYNVSLQSGIRPNPSNGIFTMDMAHGIAADAGMEIFNVFGERIYQSAVLDHSQTVDISGQPGGIYMLKLTSGKETAFAKIIIRQ